MLRVPLVFCVQLFRFAGNQTKKTANNLSCQRGENYFNSHHWSRTWNFTLYLMSVLTSCCIWASFPMYCQQS